MVCRRLIRFSLWPHLALILILPGLFISCQRHDNNIDSDDQSIPYVRPSWQNWIQNNHYPIQSLDSEDFSDLTFLNDLLKDKEIVLLGELAHGVAEQNRLRVRIIKYLHQQLGFSVVAFESGLFECYFTNRDIEHSQARDSVRNSLHGMWHTPDLLNLFEYIKASKNSAHQLQLAGFDVLFSGDLKMSRPDFFREIIEKIDVGFARTISEIEQILVSQDYYTQIAYMQNNRSSLSANYDQLIELIRIHSAFLKSVFSPEHINVALRVAESTRALISLRNDVLTGTSLGDANARDFQMYQNFNWIFDHLYKQQKIIIWAHNCHIQKALRWIENQQGGNQYSVMMGDLLNSQYRDRAYCIISLSFEGEIKLGTKIQELFFNKSECIEAILYNSNREICLVDVSRQSCSDGCSWMFQRINQTYWHSDGIYALYYIPRQQFDAVLYIKTVSPPHYF